jgi:hypothetical protein
MGATSSPRATGVRQFLDLEQQRDWIAGKIDLPDAGDRLESLQQRCKYVARFEKLLSRPQAGEVLEILGLYGPNCIPILRKTERYYWSVSCLPSTSVSVRKEGESFESVTRWGLSGSNQL